MANSVVHAFPNNRKGEIKVVLRREGDEFTLRISDNGVGIPDNVEFEKAETLAFNL
nr:ATP-binding protein [Methanobacterium formicicum]